MPTYGLKYQTQFTSQSDPNNPARDYTLQFLFKDYTGPYGNVPGGETSVVQRCTVDDPVSPIKGQSLDITLINKGKSLPITAFQSDDDDGVQVKLLEGNNLLFIGFLVQDDFYETKVDFTHTITLSANDNLGLLKGVVLSEAEVSNAYSVVLLGIAGSGNLDVFYLSVADGSFTPTVGGTIEVQSVVYTIEAFQQVSLIFGSVLYNYFIRVNPDTPGWIPAITETVIVTGPLNLLNRNRLIDIIYACINQTNLSLLTNIYHNLYEYRQDNTRSTFEQTLIDSQTFIKGDTYMDCYTVLSLIMQTFDCTFIQANGQWNIVHWYEGRLYSNAIPGFIYDEQFKYLGNTVLDNTFNIGPEPPPQVPTLPIPLTRPIAGLTEGALRGLKFTKKTFEYKQPKYLLRNYDLQDLGGLISTTLIGTTQVSDYYAIGWDGTNGSPAVTRVIMVEVDTVINNEIARYIALWGPTFDSQKTVPSYPMDVQKNDRFTFNISFRTNISQPSPVTFSLALMVTDGTTTYYLNEDGSWVGAPGYTYILPVGDNTNQWHTITSEQCDPIPINGQLTFFLPQITDDPQNSGRQSYFKDLRIEYIPYVNDTVKVIGQQHSQTRTEGPKLFDEANLTIDDSPRNSIAGTLFMNTKTGVLQDRTQLWRYPPSVDGGKLGELTTLELLLWRAKTRTKFEGGFIGNYQQAVISLLTMAVVDFYPNKNYTFGLLTIDYKRNQFSGTLWEMYSLDDSELTAEYLFKYLYSTD